MLEKCFYFWFWKSCTTPVCESLTKSRQCVEMNYREECLSVLWASESDGASPWGSGLFALPSAGRWQRQAPFGEALCSPWVETWSCPPGRCWRPMSSQPCCTSGEFSRWETGLISFTSQLPGFFCAISKAYFTFEKGITSCGCSADQYFTVWYLNLSIYCKLLLGCFICWSQYPAACSEIVWLQNTNRTKWHVTIVSLNRHIKSKLGRYINVYIQLQRLGYLGNTGLKVIYSLQFRTAP